jgi:hypothetical protein
MWRFPLTLRVLVLLIWCRRVRKNLGARPLRLPSVAPKRRADDRSVERQVRFADRIIGLMARRGGHFCFYRSVTLAVLLRRQGVPLVVNVGARSVHDPARMKAHSWLTLDGELFYEQPNSLSIYPFAMGYNADRSVRYWIGPEFDDAVLKDEHITRGNAARPAGAPLSR